MKKNLILLLFLCIAKISFSQIERNDTDEVYKPINGTVIIERYPVTRIIQPSWNSLLNALANSQTFAYAVAHKDSCNFNDVIYGALNITLTKAQSTSDLQTYLSELMTYTPAQKLEVNYILRQNFFAIQIP